MARKFRIQYEGAIYHVMSRGNGKAAVFHNDVDRRSFVQTLAEACAKTDWQVHAYCLMKTHFHLVLETPRSNLVPGIDRICCIGKVNEAEIERKKMKVTIPI